MLMLANASARALGLVSLPLLTNWLAPTAFGQAALASTLISLVSVVWLMGMDMSYSRSFLSRTPPNGMQAETFCWRLSWLQALAAGSSAALAWMIYTMSNGVALRSIAVLVFTGAAGSVLLAMAQTRSRLYNRHTRLAISVALGGICATGMSLFLAWHPLPDERALVIGYVAAYLMPILVMGMPSLRQLRRPSGLDATERKAVFLVGLPGIVTAPVYWIVASSDRWFLQAFTDAGVVGIYSVACTFGLLGMMINSALLAIWLPEATRVHESGAQDSDRQLTILMSRLMALMAIVCLGICALGPDLLRWLTSPRFHGAAQVVPLLAAGVFFYGCYHLARTSLYLQRNLGVDARISAMGAVLSLLANYFLVPRFGMVGAATVQCLSFAALALMVFGVAQRRHPLPLPVTRLLAGIVLLACAVVLVGYLDPITGINSALAKGLLVAALAVALAWTFDDSFPALVRRGAEAARTRLEGVIR